MVEIFQKIILVFIVVWVLNCANSVNAQMQPPALPRFETRCGWLDNPTPANVWFTDRDGEWLIGVQGGYQAEGEWPWPKFKPRQWTKTNNNYGYGCACLRVRVDRTTKRVIEIKSSRARPLSACNNDKFLEKR